MTKSASVSAEQVSSVVAMIPVNGMIPGNVDQDDFLAELLSGIEQPAPGANIFTAIEQDQLALVEDVAAVTPSIEAAPAPVVTPKKAAAKPATAKPAAAKKPAAKKATAPAEPTEVKPPVDAAPVVEASPAPAPEPAKPAPAPRIVFALKSQKISHKLGDKARDFLMMDVKDADLSDEELGAKQTALLKAVDMMAVKVGEKATMLFGYLRNGGKLNEVMRRTFTVLLADGFLTTGDKGNLVTNLEKKPYSIGTCRSQSTQMFQLFPALGICHEREAGKLVMNEGSTILMKMKAELGL